MTGKVVDKRKKQSPTSTLEEQIITQKLQRWSSYIAIGDSHTEGMMDCEDGVDQSAPMIGWADRLAAQLSARRVALGLSPIRYANLAVRGKKIKAIRTEQFASALAQNPALISIVAGGNDLIRLNADVDALARKLESMVVAARAQGADVLMGTGADPKGSPILELTRERATLFNCHIWSIARRHGAYVVDMWGLRTLRTRSAWANDRLHLSTTGHELLTQAALQALGIQDPPDSFDAYQGQDLRSWTRREHLEWSREYFLPWVNRHLHGRSTGDGREPKYPLLTEFPPQPEQGQ